MVRRAIAFRVLPVVVALAFSAVLLGQVAVAPSALAGSERLPDLDQALPTDLVVRRIESTCPPSGTVLDPFCGLGTALVAAARLGRDALGFEISSDFANEARQSLRQIKKKSNQDV